MNKFEAIEEIKDTEVEIEQYIDENYKTILLEIQNRISHIVKHNGL